MARFTRRGFLKALGTVSAACAVSALPVSKAEARDIGITRRLMAVKPEHGDGPLATRFDVMCGWAVVQPAYAIRVVDVD